MQSVNPRNLARISRALTATAVTAFAVIMLAGCGGTAMPAADPVIPDTKPSFGIPALPDTNYPVRVALPNAPLPAASGGNGELTYTLAPIPPGLSFDAASRVLSGAPTTVGVYEMAYGVADEDGDPASLTFKATVVHSMIFWTDFGTGKIHSANLDGSGVKVLLTTIAGAEPHGIALDVPGNKMYWVEHTTQKVRRANLDGSGAEDLVTDESSNPRSIALDVIGGKMYWTDTGTETIRRANLDGTGVEELVYHRVGYPTAIALDVIGGKMYWADADNGNIRRANLDGSGVEEVVTGLDQPYGIALDVISGKVYWTDRGDIERIQRANLDGTDVEDLVTDESRGEPGEIVLDLIGEGKMYWTAQTDKAVRHANSDGSSVEDLMIPGLDEPYGIALH